MPTGPAGPSLYATNTPAAFWRLLAEPAPTAADWAEAVRNAAPQLPAAARAGGDGLDSLLYHTLGEAQFGHHWELGAAKRFYYTLKPLLPRRLTRRLRQLHRGSTQTRLSLGWPIEPRYAAFLWEVVRQLMARRGQTDVDYIHFWPRGHRFAFVLTHDVETAQGQARVRELADLDRSYGFRSSFNFVPARYPLDRDLMHELQNDGFEVGVHGLNHDGKLFRSHAVFLSRVGPINRAVKEFGASGFRSPLMLRHPEWMQALEIDYDLSFFDTDPYEPIPGGTMSLWPFQLGRFMELPYTLVQDYTLTSVLRESTPRLWLDKVDFIRAYRGMALVNTHPDYLGDATTRRVYSAFLEAMRARADGWNALPKEVARWWRARRDTPSVESLPGAVASTVSVSGTAAAPDDLSLAS